MHLIQLKQTNSTNSYLHQLLTQSPELPEYTLVDTYSQTDGRGQRGNHWESNPGENITCSLLLRPTLPPTATTFDLNIVVSLALRHLLIQHIDPHKVKVKWPNDIMVDNHKIAGILIENQWLGDSWQYAIVGVGLNVKQTAFRTYRPQATSIALQGGKLPQKYQAWHTAMLTELVQNIQQQITTLQSSIATLRQAYHTHLLGYQEAQEYQLPTGEKFRGTITQVHPNGLLEVSTPQGFQTYAFKEISWIGNDHSHTENHPTQTM